MKKIIILVMSLLLISLTEKAIADNVWIIGDTIDVFSAPYGSTFNVPYRGHGVWLKSGPINDGGWYDWDFPTGPKSTYKVYYDPIIEEEFMYYINHNGGHGNISFLLIFHLPQTSTQTLSICSGQSITVGTNTYTTAGTYIDTIQGINGPDTIMTTNLSVNSFPTISFETDTLEIQQGQLATLDPIVTDANAYLWSSGEETSTITVGTTGTYYVTVSNDCGSQADSVHVDVITGLQPIIADFDPTLIEVWDIYGHLVIMANSVDISALKKGIYIIKNYYAGGIAHSSKIIKL